MSDLGEVKCHAGASFVSVLKEGVAWTEKKHGNYPSPYNHCTYCGSIHFEDVKRVLAEGGRLGGADWKGWPHKFYVYAKNGDMVKFYNDHLNDLPEDEFKAFAGLLKVHTGIEFTRREDGALMYSAPRWGHQVGF